MPHHGRQSDCRMSDLIMVSCCSGHAKAAIAKLLKSVNKVGGQVPSDLGDDFPLQLMAARQVQAPLHQHLSSQSRCEMCSM